MRITCLTPRFAALAGLAVAACITFGMAPGATVASAQTRTAAGERQEARPDLATFPHDTALFRVLTMEPGPVQFDSLLVWESRRGYLARGTLADIAEDPSIHPLLRANAVLLIGRRHDLADLIILMPLLEAEDPRIRLATVAAAQEYLPVREAEAMAIISAALSDESEAVQARALEGITDRDPALLRQYVARGPSPGLAAVANGLIAAAEERGAALAPTPDGRLLRTGPGGHTLEYRPTTAWRALDLSVGTLVLRTADGREITVGDSIEVARNVVPAFFSVDGRYLVFEESRTIHVLDIGQGTDRVVGPGIAPRPLPFSGDFVFARQVEGEPTRTRMQARIQYDLRIASFADATVSPDVIGSIKAVSAYEVSGGASPVRWMRVAELAGSFRLIGEGIEPVALPDPFAGPGAGT